VDVHILLFGILSVCDLFPWLTHGGFFVLGQKFWRY